MLNNSPERLHSRRKSIDYFLLLIVLCLLFTGLFTILTASVHVAQTTMGDGLYFFKKQIIAAIIGFIGMIVAINLKIKTLHTYLRPAIILVAILLIATHLPGIGLTVRGSTRWVNIFGMSIQPSEIAKLVMVLFTATILSHPLYHKYEMFDKGILFLPIIGITGMVLFQPDLGTTLVIASSVFVIFFISGMNYFQTFGLTALGAIGVLVMSWHTPYQKARLLAFVDPWSDPRGIGYHLIQSLMAIGSGGFWGKGVGQSVQKLFYLPEQHTDFIFAIFAEENGFIGTFLYLLLILLFARRGFSIAYKSKDYFTKLLVAGLTALICGQAIINIGVVTGSLPTTGVPLPFMSYGGSYLIITLFSVGLILNASKEIPHKHFKVITNRLDLKNPGGQSTLQ